MKKDKESAEASLKPTEQEAIAETEKTDVSSVADTNAANMTRYATDYFKSNKIPYCLTCGAQHQNMPSGEPVCAESRNDCPRMKSSS